MSPRGADYALEREPEGGSRPQAERSSSPGGGSRSLDEGATHLLGGSGEATTAVPVVDPAATGASPTAADIRDTLDRQELRGDQERLRRLAILGAAMFPSFWPVDWIAHTLVEPVHIWGFLALRLIPVPVLLLFARLAARERSLSRAGVQLLQCSAFALTCLVIGITMVDFRGLESPYYPGLTLVMLLRAIFMPEPWRRSLPTILICWISLPIVLGAAGLLYQDIARQWLDPEARGTFLLHQINLTWTAAVALVGGHTMSRLRRSVFEARAVGRYRLKRRLGRGAMGEVWAAAHPRLKQEVAVKLLDHRFSDSATAVARFEREVEATARLTHPNTVRVLDYGVTDDGVWYYAMELLEGRDLAALVREEGPLPAARAARIVFQAARAIGEAHDRGIVHRDLKPENVFLVTTLRDEDVVKVLDFGIARQDDVLDASLTHPGAFLGTPRYASPEVASGQATTARSDVYGLAGILYFLITGTPPYDERSLEQLLAARLLREVDPPSHRLGAPVPEGLEQIVAQGLARDPERRFADANELAAALDRWLRSGEYSATAEGAR
jgi:serine/threonine-protein kinase